MSAQQIPSSLETAARPKRGRRSTVLRDDGSAVAKLKLYLRSCLAGATLARAAARIECSKSTLSKALNGTKVPTLELTLAIARFPDGQEPIVQSRKLWEIAALEKMGLSAADLAYPSPKNARELAVLLQAYMVTHVDPLVGWAHLFRAADLARLSAHPHIRGRMSISTIDRMLSGRSLPSEDSLEAFLRIVGVGPVAFRRIRAVHLELVRRERAGRKARTVAA